MDQDHFPTPASAQGNSPTPFEVKGTEGAPLRSKTLPPPPDWAIAQALGLERVHITWLAGDGSDRCYYRVFDQDRSRSFVLMQLSGDDAIQLQKDGYEWVKISALLKSHGVAAPGTIAVLSDFAALIIEDYGDTMLETFALQALEAQQRDQVLAMYREVFPILHSFLAIREAGRSHWRDRSFDQQRLEWELHFFREQFLENVLQWKLSIPERDAFDHDCQALAESLAQSSQYFVHRDFHSRNIMYKDGELAVIDFQDARLGPPTYDLVSLCYDSYIPFTQEERSLLIQEGIQVLSQGTPGLKKEHLEREIGPMLLQRQLKAIGSYGYLTTHKNRGNYLKNVGPALATLDQAVVGHHKWSFLSQDFLQNLKARWLKFDRKASAP